MTELISDDEKNRLYQMIVEWQTTDDPTFKKPRNRFYYRDLYVNEMSKKMEIRLMYADDDWQYVESKYLCNLIDCLILDSVFAVTIYSKCYLNIGLNAIPEICGLSICTNPFFAEIMKEVSSHYDRRGFYNLIVLDDHSINDNPNYVFRILFFRGLLQNPLTIEKETDKTNPQIFKYRKRLVYIKSQSDQPIEGETCNWGIFDSSVLNDPTYRMMEDRHYDDLFFLFNVIKLKYPNINLTYYCEDEPIFTPKDHKVEGTMTYFAS
jgi:hypothetical protein